MLGLARPSPICVTAFHPTRLVQHRDINLLSYGNSRLETWSIPQFVDHYVASRFECVAHLDQVVQLPFRILLESMLHFNTLASPDCIPIPTVVLVRRAICKIPLTIGDGKTRYREELKDVTLWLSLVSELSDLDMSKSCRNNWRLLRSESTYQNLVSLFHND